MKARSFVLPVALRQAAIAAAAITVAAPAAHAQWSSVLNGARASSGGTAVYEWEGRVDQEIRLQLRDSRASIIRVGSRETLADNGRELSAIPRQPGQVTIERLAGRGSVSVIQQPNASNGYTAVVRLVDGDAGASTYHLIAYWQPTGGYGNGGNGGYDNGGGYGRGGSNNGGSNGGYDNGGGYGRGGSSGGYGTSGSSGDYDHDGYDRGGYDRNGRDRGGFDRNGYDRNGFDKRGYDRNGYDRNGRDRRGAYRSGNGQNGNGNAYGHDDRRDQRDDKYDRKQDKRDDKRDKRDEKRDDRDDRDEHGQERDHGRHG